MSKPVKPSVKKALFNADVPTLPIYNPPRLLLSNHKKPRSRLGRRLSRANINASTASLQFGCVSGSLNQECISQNLDHTRTRSRLKFPSFEANPAWDSLFIYKPNLKQDILKKQNSTLKCGNADSKTALKDGEIQSTSSGFVPLETSITSTAIGLNDQLKKPISPEMPIANVQEVVNTFKVINATGEVDGDGRQEELNGLYNLLFKKMNEYEIEMNEYKIKMNECKIKMNELQNHWTEMNIIKKKIESFTKGCAGESVSVTSPTLKKSCMKSGKKQKTETVTFNQDIIKSFTLPATPSSVRSKLQPKKSIGYTPKSLKKILDHQCNELFD